MHLIGTLPRQRLQVSTPVTPHSRSDLNSFSLPEYTKLPLHLIIVNMGSLMFSLLSNISQRKSPYTIIFELLMAGCCEAMDKPA